MNILLTCAGRRNHTVDVFKEAVNGIGGVFASDCCAEAPALMVADKAFVVPPAKDRGYVEALLEICEAHGVGLLIPALEPELLLLSRERGRFSRIGTQVMVSDPEVVGLCYDKLGSQQFLEKLGIPTPHTCTDLSEARLALDAGLLRFPLVLKPRWGVSSVGLSFPENQEELERAYKHTLSLVKQSSFAQASEQDPDRCIMIQERIYGQEYGLDVVNDLQGNHMCTLAKRKLRMSAGRTDRAVSVTDATLSELGQRIGSHLRHRGVLDCDVLVTEKSAFPIDLNPRLGGGYPFSHLAGANLPAALVDWARGLETDPVHFQMRPGVLASRYDAFSVRAAAVQ